MKNSRIVAIALISIILSSSSFSVVDGYTVWVNINNIKSTKPDFENESKFYNINLIDNVAASLSENRILDPSLYQIKLFDGASIILKYYNEEVDQIKEYQASEIISINLSDGISSDTTDFGNNDDRIILIKQSSDRKALWERIFPLDRIRNISKSFFKIIQNDYNTSYVQLSEINTNNDENSLERARIYGSELENLSEFEKFVGKADYVYNQIGIRAFDLLDAQKFVGKANFVGIQLAQHAQHLADPKKFIGKSSYVADQIAIRAQHLADPEKFVGKSMFVGQQITIQVYPVVDPHNPTLLILLIPLIGIVLIRNENDRIKFYNIQKIVSFIFVVILISSAIITPFSYSVMYWGYAFAEEDPLGTVGPPEEPGVEQLDETVEDVMEENAEPPPVEEPVLPPESVSVEEPVAEPIIESPPDVPVDVTSSEPNNIIPTRNDLSTTFDENIVLTDNTSNELEQHIETQQTKNNQTISLDETFNLTDIISLNNKTQQNKLSISLDETIVLTDEITSPDIPQNQSESLPEYLSFIDDIVLLLQNQTIPSIPNATESWQFENDTDNADLIGDATIDYTEGINGTSLLLDGQLDYAQTNSTNATTYITDMSIAAWVKPNYTNGSPEFTVVSKGKSFVLSINNIIEPQHVAKFSVFDGIKWTTVESYSTIPDDSWSHITARFNKTSIALYVNGTLEGTVTHGGVPYVTEKGQIELKTLQEITSYQDIVIGASLTPNMESRAFNMFSGMIDGVQLFDSRLEPDDIILLYQTTVPIKAPIPVPEIRRPEPVLRYRIIKGNETLPISIPAEDLDETNQLTISTWIKPNFTGGSPEFTVLSRENSFILSLNKMLSPEKIAKFSVYDGISWHTVTGSTPIGGWTQVAAVVNGSRISIYINGTLDGKLETGPPWIAGSTANVTIGAYENTLRGGAEWSNYYFGEIGEAVVWEYSMVDREMEKEYLRYINQYTNSSTGITTFTLNDGVKSVDYIGISNNTEGKLEVSSEETSDTLRITDNLILNLNGIPIIPLDESLVFYDNLTLTLNSEQETQVNATILPQTLAFSDSLYLKLNGTVYTYLEEGLFLTEDILLLLNNQTVTFSNSTSRLTHGIIEIGKPVDWTQTVMLNETDLQNILVELPADAQNIQIQKTDNNTSVEISDENLSIIASELEPGENEFDIPRIKDIDLNEIAKEYEVGNVVPLDYVSLENLDEIKQKDKPTVALLINETGINANVPDSIIPQNNTQQNQTEYTIQFQTPAPYAIENDYSTETKYQKNVTVAHDSTLHYTDVRSYTDIPEYLAERGIKFKLDWIINETKVDVTNDPRFVVTFVDTDGNGITDRMEWTVPQLSAQEFKIEGIINITKATHLDENREVIEDVYPQVKERDGIWTQPIPKDHYIRVSFEKNLGPENDISIYAKSNYSNSSVEVYEVDSNILIASFGTIDEDKKYRIFLTNLNGTHHTFDLKIVGNPIEFDFIIDPPVQPHAYVEQTTLQTFTGTTNYKNIPGAVIPSNKFNPGDKYLLVFSAYLGGSDTGGGDYGIQAARNGVAFDGSEMVLDPETDLVYYPYTWFTVWTAVAGQNVTLQYRTLNSADTVEADQISIFALNLGGQLKENRDWYHASVTASTTLTPLWTWSTTNNAAVTFTPTAANHDWLVIGTGRIDTDGGGSASEDSRIRRSGERAATLETVRWERQDGTNDRYIETMFNVTRLGAVSNTFTQESRTSVEPGAPVDVRTHSQIFALDLGRFANHGFAHTQTTSAQIAQANNNYTTQVQTLGFTPSVAGPVWIMGQFSSDDTGNNNDGYTKGRMQVDNVDQPPTQTTDSYRQIDYYDPIDILPIQYQTLEYLSAAAHTIDLDASSGYAPTDRYVGNRTIFAVVMDLAPLEGTESQKSFFIVPDAAAPGMNVNVQIIGNNFASIDKVTTNSSDIVVGPTLVYDTAGNVVTSNGVVLSTTFFIDKTAAPQAVNVTVAGANVTKTFEIKNTATKFAGTGDYTGKTGKFILGDNTGINGNRTRGGTIILDSLIVPATVTLNITLADIDPTVAGNQGYLPTIILVDGPVDILGTLNVSGSKGYSFNTPIVSRGGDGGPGGGGGGAGGVKEEVNGYNGGSGFTGGGAGGVEDDAPAGPAAGTGGIGTGAAGDGPDGGDGNNDNGGNGGNARYGTATGGEGGHEEDEGGDNGGGGGGGGTGWAYGSGGRSNAQGVGVSPSGGNGGGGAGGIHSEGEHGGGGGFGTAGQNAPGSGFATPQPGLGGGVTGNSHLMPLGGGSGGGGGSPDTGGATTRDGGGGGGGGGSLWVYATGNMTIRGTGQILADGGRGGNGFDTDCCGAGGGGGGSGGAIMLQSQNVTTSTGRLNSTGNWGGIGEVTGGAGAPPANAGDGGDGRIRVDGVPTGATIPGTIPTGPLGGGPTQYVGPAITNITNTKVIGRGAANALIEAWITNGTHFHVSNTTANANGDFTAYVSYFAGTNYITIEQFTSATVGVMSSGATYVAQEVSPLPSFTDISSTIDVGTSPSDTAGRGGAVVFLDANNDGYLDVYFNDDDAADPDDKLILNDKDNTFTDDSGAPLAGQGQGAGAGDYDNDKDVDLIVGQEESLYTNDGTSTWTLTDLADANPEALMFIDIDGDADLDIWAPGQNFMWYRSDVSSAGPNNVASHTARASSGCTNPTNAFVSDNVRTDCDGAAPPNNDVSDYHNLGFAVPAGATIKGVEVNVEHAHNNCPNDSGYWTATLRNDVGNLIGTAKISASSICHAADQTDTFGGGTDLWGATLTQAMVNDADFGVSVFYTPTGGGGGNDGLIDNINIRVFYIPPTFTGQTALPGLAATNVNGEGASAADVDNDGDLDLIFSRSSTDNEIYIRSATNTYTQESDINGGGGITGLPDTAAGGVADHENMEWAWGDYDNDSDLDVYISGADSEGLYRNNGAGAFTQVNVTAGVSIKDPDGAAWGDYDNDGYLDLILANVTETSKLYRNNGDGTFNDTAASAGINHKGDIGKTVGFFDSDNDGDLDIISNNPLNLWRNNLYLNTVLSNNANNSFKVFAFGNGTNAGGKVGSPVTPIGAQITIRDSSTNALLGYREIIPSQNQLAPPHQQHFGLNPNKVFNIEVLFPSKTTVTLQYCTQTNIPDLYKVKYGGYTVPLAFNVTETSGSQTLFCGIQKSVKDSASVQDGLKAIKIKLIKDTANVNDVLRARTTKPLADSASANDDITTIGITLQDDLAAVEDILVKAPVNFVIKDTANVNDVLRFATVKQLADSASANDDITTIGITLQDDLAAVEDILVKAPVNFVIKDTATINDVLRATTIKPLSDSATVNDILRPFIFPRLFDSATVQDTLVKVVTYRPKDSALVQDVLKATTIKPLSDSATVNDILRPFIFPRLFDSATVQDTLVKVVTYRPKDSALVQDVLKATTIKPLSDSATVNDTLTVIPGKTLFDSATVQDTLVKVVTYRPKDSALVQDVLKATTIKPLSDSATVNDTLTVIPGKTLFDSATVQDTLVKVVTYRPKDSALVQDVLRATTIKPLSDSATVNDTLTVIPGKTLFDSATVQDTLVKVVTYRPKDSALVQDVLRATTIKPLSDSATVDDHITAIQGKLLFDSATVQDTLVKVVTYRPKDSALVQDVLRATTIKPLSDSATVDDHITAIQGKLLFDSATVQDTLVKVVTYRPKDSALVQDVLRATTIKPLSDSATVDDHITAIQGKLLFDSATVNDVLRANIIKVLKDSASVNDTISFTAIMALKDSATVDDVIIRVTVAELSDSATVQDTLVKVVTYRPKDSALGNDRISRNAVYRMNDVAIVDDVIRPVLFKNIVDTTLVEDRLLFTVIIRINDTVRVDDEITITGSFGLILNPDSATVEDSITKTVFSRPQDSVAAQDLISFNLTNILKDSATVSEVIRKVAQPPPKDSGTVSDTIVLKIVTIRIADTIQVNDMIRVNPVSILSDSAMVDDHITVIPGKRLFDSATVDDLISIYVTKIIDDAATVDDIIYYTAIKGLKDSSTVDDNIHVDFGKIIGDSATVDDSISIYVTKIIEDAATVDDTISKTAIIRIIDTAQVNDFIITSIGKIVQDSASVDDTMLVRITFRLSDSVLVQDTEPIKNLAIGLVDSANVDDNIRKISVKYLFDSATVEDSITKTVFSRPQDSVSVNDDITKIVYIVKGENVLVDDNIRVVIIKKLSDSAMVSDYLTKTAIARPQDSVSVDDDITKIVYIVKGENVLVDDNIRVVIIKKLSDSAMVSDYLTKTAIARPQDSVSVDDDITKIVYIVKGENVLVDDNIRVVIIKKLSDSAMVSDYLTKTVFSRPQDSVSVNDDITKVVYLVQGENVLVDDNIRVVTIKPVFDSATVEDSITKTVFSRPQDSVSVNDDITKVVYLVQGENVLVDDNIRVVTIKPVFDSATVEDSITKTVFSRPQDSVSVDDTIRKIVTMNIQDDVASVEDIISIAPVTFRIKDSTSINDTIRKNMIYRVSDVGSVQDMIKTRITKQIKDSAVVRDQISFKITRDVKDTIKVDDSLRFQVTKAIKDSASINDHIVWTLARSVKDTVSVNDILRIMPIKFVKDSAVVNDVIVPIAFYRRAMLDTISDNDYITPMGTLNIETRDDNDNLVPLSNTYRIIPNPFTGLGSLLVTDGDPNDYDGVLDNGQISVFPVPLDTYRINQTISPAGYSSLINFTYTTVHHTDLNATALFRVILDPAELPVLQQKSDILDIANNGFDDLLSSVQLVKVNNGAQVIINYTTDMPAPIFAGANNATAISNAIASQFTLLYNNLVLPPNDSPEDIISKFRQTPYDAGNFTKTTFVGVMAATNQAASRQYLATQPFDKFNCGQEYIYSIDDTLVPTFGGMTGFDMNMSSTGVCPDAQDYLTFEISQVPPAGAGVPTLSGEDILLYVNPQFPNGSITGIGVDFSDSSNIDSFRFTLISPLPETNSTSGLTVYLQAGVGWSTAGVTILSKQLITTGPNAGMIEIIVSVDHLAKMVVGGKRIIPPPPPIPFGQGLIRVGPVGVASGAPDMPTARIHRVEYDVCNENIVRILAAHDSSSPPRIQLLTTKSGVIDATLSSTQPFANQNKITLVDRYLFEAPLSKGESVFTIFAVDYHSNVQRTLVQVDGCQGVLVFADDQIVLPHIFDIKYQTNSTYIRPTDYSYITQGQDMTVSAIVSSPIVPLGKAELFFTILGTAEQKVLPMTITPLILPDLENVSVISGIIPANLLKGPAVEYWIRIVTAEGVVQESVHSIVGVKPEGYSGESSVEMDTITIKAQGTTLKPTTYLTNEGDIPVYVDVSLVAEGKKVYSKPVLLTPGQNIINLEWKIPKTDQTTSYNIQTQLDVYDKSYITGIATLDTFVRTKIVPMSAQSEIVPATDELGNTIARPAMMYSSNDGIGEFRVTAPDGTCVIGAGCIVEESTLKHHGGIDSVLIDGHIYRVRYSGENSPLERFSITSLDSVLGEWNVTIADNSPFTAAAAEDVPIKVQYRAERSPMVTVGS